MTTTQFDFTPYIPQDSALERSNLPDKAVELVRKSAALRGSVSMVTMATVSRHMEVINSYYSNLIEGNATLPHEVRAAQLGEFSADPAKRDLQKESLAHIAVQRWLAQQQFSLAQLYTPQCIREIHRRFYEKVPESLWKVTDPESGEQKTLTPGAWRERGVIVGRHIPPESSSLGQLVARFSEIYAGDTFRGDRRLIALAAAHHRFAWVHPFLDGNGRVGRLISDAAFRAAGLESYGLWCLSRGLARSSGRYKLLLAGADAVRQGDYDGRGALTERGLTEFCEFMLDTALDQVDYATKLLNLAGVRERIRGYIKARSEGRVTGLAELHPQSAVVIYQAFVEGELSRADALALTGMPERSGRRLLKQLKDDGLLSEESHRSPLHWEIPVHAEPWYFPQLAPGYTA